ncbi:MAG TPA: DUF488 domain-containing protein [Ktedonobacteraceae bacterium]|nr:DUF488 domain-containing protein [Ktedonobacteraceae bacterium]
MTYHFQGERGDPPLLWLLLTLGYATPDAMKLLTTSMQTQRTVLVDIRSQPRSRWYPAWNRSALIARWRCRYLWKGDTLGNVHYKPEDRSKGIKLAAPERGVVEVVHLFQSGYQVILLCACKYPESCHRLLVAKLVQEHLPGLLVHHLRSLVPVHPY